MGELSLDGSQFVADILNRRIHVPLEIERNVGLHRGRVRIRAEFVDPVNRIDVLFDFLCDRDLYFLRTGPGKLDVHIDLGNGNSKHFLNRELDAAHNVMRNL